MKYRETLRPIKTGKITTVKFPTEKTYTVREAYKIYIAGMEQVTKELTKIMFNICRNGADSIDQKKVFAVTDPVDRLQKITDGALTGTIDKADCDCNECVAKRKKDQVRPVRDGDTFNI